MRRPQIGEPAAGGCCSNAGDEPPAGTAGVSPAAHRGWHTRGYLPHVDCGDTVQTVTYRLADSLPREVARQQIAESGGSRSAARRRAQALLDAGHGACALRDSICAALVVDAWRYFDGQRYRLHAWVVMPNHVHVVLTVLAGHPLSGLMQTQKSFTGHRIRRHVGGSGPVWHPDYWDRFIRDDAHFVAAVEYAEDNPVRAGMVAHREDWPWSSATARRCGRDARGPSR